jgi:hypothetical protein
MGSGWDWVAMAGSVAGVCALIILAECWELIATRIRKWRER